MFETVSGTYVTFPMEPKAMHDEMGASFDMEYARMSTNLGTQLPIPKTNNANMTPFMYTDPTTEYLNAAAEPVSPVLGDGTQLWKISHNGVDMHPIHFHIFDVQVINRVGWDGHDPAARAAGARLEGHRPHRAPRGHDRGDAPVDAAAAVRHPVQPPPAQPGHPGRLGLRVHQRRPHHPAAARSSHPNVMTSFAWEYVWHCHILSHEENDMMRPIVLNVPSTIPPAFGAAPTVTAVTGANRIVWVDPTPVNYVTQAGFKNGALNDNEIGFRVERATSATGAYTVVGTARANQTTFDDTSRATATTYYRYRVVAFNEAGTSISPFASINTPTTPAMTGVTLAVSNTNTANGITSTIWTKNITSIVTPIFRATPAPTTAPAEYEFSLRMGTGATNVVQAFSPLATWTMPLATVGTVAGQAYTVSVRARTSTAGTVRTGTRSYTVRIPSPATALTVVPDIAGPVEVGSDVIFTATATGGAATKQYQFLLNGVVVQPWSAATTWTLPAITPVGTYTVSGPGPDLHGEHRPDGRHQPDSVQHHQSAADGRHSGAHSWHREPRSGAPGYDFGGLPRHRPGPCSAHDCHGRWLLLPVLGFVQRWGLRRRPARMEHEPCVQPPGDRSGRHVRCEGRRPDQPARLDC